MVSYTRTSIGLTCIRSNHQFAASSAQQYYWLETLYPAAFERVKHYVKKGRFHPVGGAWLEHDSMIPSGESLIRQYLYGQRYFKSRFGAYSKEAWLPDTFGYASQLPQILRGVGLKYFFTQKVSPDAFVTMLINRSCLGTTSTSFPTRASIGSPSTAALSCRI